MLFNPKYKLLIAIGVQFFLLFLVIFLNLAITTSGKEILLKVRPVDPRDWLRGDYVTITYDISRLEADNVRDGQTVYVYLSPPVSSDPSLKAYAYWHASAVMTEISPYRKDEVFLKGRVVRGGEASSGSVFKHYSSRSQIEVEYGIEQYFVPEGRGNEIRPGRDEVSVLVSVGKNGQGVIKKLYVNGKPWP